MNNNKSQQHQHQHQHQPSERPADSAGSDRAMNESSRRRSESESDEKSAEDVSLRVMRSDVFAFVSRIHHQMHQIQQRQRQSQRHRQQQHTEVSHSEEEEVEHEVSSEELHKWESVVKQLGRERQHFPHQWDPRSRELLAQLEEMLWPSSSATSSAAERARDSASEPEIEITTGPDQTADDAYPLQGQAAEQTTLSMVSRVLRDTSSRTLRTLMLYMQQYQGELDDDTELDTESSATLRQLRSLSRQESSSVSTSTAAASPRWPSFSRQITRAFSSYFTQQSIDDAQMRSQRQEEEIKKTTFHCQICFDQVDTTQTFTLRNCQHQFCVECLRQFLEFNISEARVSPRCFYEPMTQEQMSEELTRCNALIAPEDIRALVSADAWAKLERFRFNQEHENARQCPYCDQSQECAGAKHPLCRCVACGREFCFVHSNAHVGTSCAEYEKASAAAETINTECINKFAKRCPGCSNYVEKSGGCNQMKCMVCDTSFCWICSAIIDDDVFPQHFQWWNVGGCPGAQMSDVEDQSRCQLCLGRVMRYLFFAVFGPPALVLAVGFSLLCCCCYPCSQLFATTKRQSFTTCLCISGYLLLLPFGLVLALLLSPCLAIGYCANREETNSDPANNRMETPLNLPAVKSGGSSPSDKLHQQQPDEQQSDPYAVLSPTLSFEAASGFVEVSNV